MPNDPAVPPPAHGRDTSWAARYGGLILRDGIAAVPTALYYYQGALALSAQEVWFTSYILAHKWDSDLPYPSLNGMARCSGVDLSWLKRIRRSLTLKGWLTVSPRRDPSGRQEANSYDFAGLFAALEAQISALPVPPNPLQAPAPPDEEPDTPRDGSFVARYGRLIAQVGIAAIPQAVFTQQAALQLTAQQIWFIGYILAHRWTTAVPHPSLVRMAERTGYGVRQLHNIKDSLVQQGYLTLVARYSSQGGKDTNGYDFSGLFDAISRQLTAGAATPVVLSAGSPEPPAAPVRRRGILRTPPTGGGEPAAGGGRSLMPRGGEPAGQQREPSRIALDQQLALHNTNDPSAATPGRSPLLRGGELLLPIGGGSLLPMAGGSSLPVGGEPQMLRGEGSPLPSGGGSSLPQREVRVAQGTGVGATPAGRVATAHEKESLREDPPHKEDDSNQSLSLALASRATPPPYSPYIAGVVLDYSREFGDGPHAPANISQALGLWHTSHLAEEPFVQMLHSARSRVRRAQGRQGQGSITNKMAYFFVVVRDLLTPPAAPPVSGPSPETYL